MDTTSLSWSAVDGWQQQKAKLVPNLVLYFGSRETLTDAGRYRELREMFPDACLMGCSTDGQICSDEIIESGVNAIGVRFDATTIRTAIETAENASGSPRLRRGNRPGAGVPTISPACSCCRMAWRSMAASW